MYSEKFEVSKSSYEFLWYSCFRRPYDCKNKELICADRAYLDLCRTIRFKSKDETEHRAFRNKTNKLIVGLVGDLLNQKEFDENLYTWYEEACEKIIYEASEVCKEFYFGHAQKWLNMTVKYMLVMGIHKEEFDVIKPYLHIPVDNYIIKAAREKFGIKISSEVWSKWEGPEYREFQRQLRAKTEGSAVDWEASAWIEIADKENKKSVGC
ncbi:MAG: hypothetical protein IKT46_09420 [Clostridia bacterium]|nr:hypothetical protein [Clostridia bacterium]